MKILEVVFFSSKIFINKRYLKSGNHEDPCPLSVFPEYFLVGGGNMRDRSRFSGKYLGFTREYKLPGNS